MLETSDEEKVDVKSNVVIFRFFLGKVLHWQSYAYYPVQL